MLDCRCVGGSREEVFRGRESGNQIHVLRQRSAGKNSMSYCKRAILLVLLAGGAPSFAEESSAVPGSLARYVPADVWMVFAEVATPEREFVAAHWARVHRALASCGIDREFRAAIRASLPEGERTAFDQTWDRLVGAIGKVNWRDLAAHEVIVAERFAGIFPDIFVILRPAAETRAENIAALSEIFQTVGNFNTNGQLTLTQEKRQGVTVCALDLCGAPLGVYLLHKDDVIAIVVGKAGKDDTIALLSGQGQVKSLLDNPRFREALREMPAAEYAYSFLDLHKLFEILPALPRMIMGQAHAEQQAKEQAADPGQPAAPPPDNSHVDQVLRIFATVMDHLDIIDYVVMTQRMEGHQELAYTAVRAKPAAREKPIYRMLTQRTPIASFERYVPVEAKAFSVSTMLDVEILYELILQLVRENAPAHVSSTWEQLQRDWGFDVREDLLSWFSGEMISVGLPLTTPSPFGADDSVVLLRVKDAAKARSKVAVGLQRLAAFMADRGQAVQYTPLKDFPAEGFQRVYTGLLAAMMIQPCVGVWEDWLVVGTSESAVRSVLETAAGRHANIRENARFRSEGVAADGPVCSASFKDLSCLGQELTGVLTGLGFAGGSIPDEPETRSIRLIFRSLGSLAPVVNEMNFFSSASSTTMFADGVWRSTTKVTYKPPAESAKAAP
jgi:hypothetical protein